VYYNSFIILNLFKIIPIFVGIVLMGEFVAPPPPPNTLYIIAFFGPMSETAGAFLLKNR
jgi:hypothetical protein